MKYCQKYKTENDFQIDKNKLFQLENFVSLISENNKIHIKPLIFTIKYDITQNLIDNAQPLTNNELPLITRCDLFKSIKIDGEEIDLSSKMRTPYVFQSDNDNDLMFELSSLILKEKGFNEKYVLSKHFDEPTNGIIEVEWNENIKTLIGAFSFASCISEFSEDLLKIFVPNSFSSIFSSCSNLKDFKLKPFKSNKLTDLFSAFSNCSNLLNIDVSNIDTTHVKNMSSMFMNNARLTQIDLSSFKTPSLTNMYSMFLNCANLTTINISNFTTNLVTDMESLFYGCTSLQTLYADKLSIENIKDYNNMFKNCNNLSLIRCTNEFKEWCLLHKDEIKLPENMNNDESWEII